MNYYSYVSGAVGGLGSAFVEELAKGGNNLFLTDRYQEKLEALKQKINQKYPNVLVEYFACNLIVPKEREDMLSFIDGKQIKFNKIINVAGVDIQKPFEDYTTDKIRLHVGVNVDANVELNHAFLSRRAPETEIITISSMSGVAPMPYFALYSATKALLFNLFCSLHYELKDKGVKVTVVLPGGIYTRPDVIEDIKSQGLGGKLSSMMPEEVAKRSLKAVKKNKLKYIPGFFNKFLYFLETFLPQKLVIKFISKRWKNRTRDVF